MDRLEPIAHQVIALVKEVGVFAYNERKTFTAETVRRKSNQLHDLVSHVDIESEKLLIKGLSDILPAADFISEETNSTYKPGLNWVVDPIDGTTNFIQGIPHYCISVALVQDQEIVLGVVLEINRGECFYTWKGGASYCNGQVISVSDKEDLDDTFVATGFSVKNHSQLDKNLELLKIWIERTRGIRRLGTAALDLCYVANGIFDLFYETELSAWDVAAGALIVKNAKGEVTDFEGGGGFLFGNTIIATNGVLHQTFLSEIKKLSNQ